MKTLILYYRSSVNVCGCIVYAWDDDVRSETYQKYDTYGMDINPPGSIQIHTSQKKQTGMGTAEFMKRTRRYGLHRDRRTAP